ncbi:restriction endonuclease subunit S [Azospirillum sp.]|uniref:restriction endonuclease subunit S n=1 Tax=Azospirillum sp. TaxID=34012 RepID=UPI002D548DBA|nr:restriction endonuclease subunit S [Azospirillum sp.]HYD64141.1 restriction endonuclease subunit S [Azospirillum sp.]
MKDQNKNTLKPKLRFPEFVGQSLQKLQLRDVTAESTVRNGETLPVGSVMGVTKTEGIVPMQERLIASDIARYKLVRKDWFAYNPMRLNIGSIARWKRDNDILVSPDYVVFKCLKDSDLGIDPAYLDHFRQTAAWENFVTEGGNGGVRVRIYYEDIARLHLALPSPAEQRKIAECLASLDELLAVEGRKLEALRAHKKGLMQQLFPREGESRPRLRFPEFRDAGEWEATPLGKIADIKLGKMLSAGKHTTGRLLPYLNNIAVRWNEVDTSKLPQMYFDDDELERFGLKAGDVVVCEGGEPGRSAVWDGRMPDIKFQKAIHRVRFNVPFVPHLLVSYLEAIAGTERFEMLFTGGGIKHLTLETFAELTIPLIPFAEQQRIAACLSSLDALITAASRRLDGLRAHKKGLLQQLFPSPEEV